MQNLFIKILKLQKHLHSFGTISMFWGPLWDFYDKYPNQGLSRLGLLSQGLPSQGLPSHDLSSPNATVKSGHAKWVWVPNVS